MPKPFTTERLAFIEELLDEGWSFRQIQLTYGHCSNTLAKYFPGRGMSKSEGAKLGAAASRAFRNMNRA